MRLLAPAVLRLARLLYNRLDSGISLAEQGRRRGRGRILRTRTKAVSRWSPPVGPRETDESSFKLQGANCLPQPRDDMNNGEHHSHTPRSCYASPYIPRIRLHDFLAHTFTIPPYQHHHFRCIIITVPIIISVISPSTIFLRPSTAVENVTLDPGFDYPHGYWLRDDHRIRYSKTRCPTTSRRPFRSTTSFTDTRQFPKSLLCQYHSWNATTKPENAPRYWQQ